MKHDRNYRFIHLIHELTTAQKEILQEMIHLANGIGGECKIKMEERFNYSSATIANAKKRLIELNIIQKIKKAFTFKINDTSEWKVENMENYIWFHIFDFVPEWIHYLPLKSTEKAIYVRINGSIPKKEYRPYEIRKKMSTLAKELNISQKVVKRGINKLIALNLIVKERSYYDKSKHRPAKYIPTTANLWHQDVIDCFPYRIKQMVASELLKELKKEHGVEKGLLRDDNNTDHMEYEKQRRIGSGGSAHTDVVNKKIFSFTAVGGRNNNNKKSLVLSLSIENSLLDSLRESEDNKLSSSSLSGNSLGGSATSKVSLNRKLFKNKTQNKPKDNLEQNKSLRSKLKDSHKHEENKRNKKLEVKPSTKTLSILNRWNKLCDDYPRIYTRPKQDQKNKTYREIVDSLNKLFRGTLYARGSAVLPQGFEPFEQKFTLKEVETFLERLHIQLIDPNIGVTPFKNRKANLREFLMGSPRTGAPSKLLSCCWNEPKSLNIEHTEDVETLKKLYREHVDPDRVFTFRDLEAFDKCAAWGEPLYTQLERTFGRHSNFVTMVYMSSIKSVQKVANGSVNPTLFGKEFVERMTKQRMQKLGYTL